MRVLLLFAVLASAAAAQRDPTPPQDYFPLEVGNEWVYHYASSSPLSVGDYYERRRVLRTEAVAGQTYAVDQTCRYDNLATAPAWACEPERLVRFDRGTTNVLVRDAGGERVEICTLGADFGAPLPNGCSALAYFDFAFTDQVQIGGIAYPVSRIKGQSTLAHPNPPPFAASIGPLEQIGIGPLRIARFEFARVRGVEYGK